MELRVDGRRVFAATGGQDFDPSRAVVLLHGAGMDHTVWQLQTRWLAHHGRAVLAVDLPGHGGSDGPPLASVDEMARWTLALLDAAGAKDAALVGHSMGALVALATASIAPHRVRALALLGVTPEMSVHPDMLASARAGDSLASELMCAWGFGARAQLGGHRAPGLWMVTGGLRLIGRADPAALAADLAACNEWKGALAAAGQVKAPAMLILGSDDKMTPAARAKPLASALSGARTTVIAGAGHMMMIERPDETLTALQQIV